MTDELQQIKVAIRKVRRLREKRDGIEQAIRMELDMLSAEARAIAIRTLDGEDQESV